MRCAMSGSMDIKNAATATDFAADWIRNASPVRARRFIKFAAEGLEMAAAIDRSYGRTDVDLLAAIGVLRCAIA